MAAYTLFLRQLFSYNANVGNHAVTQRFTYTVPTGKRAEITEIFLDLIQTTVAAAPASTTAGCYIQISGNIFFINYSSQVQDDDHIVYDGVLQLQAGDVVAGFTFNAAAAINYTFTLSMAIKEYQ